MNELPNKESLIEEIKRISKVLGKQIISRSEFLRESGISEWQIRKYFDSYNDLVISAGLLATENTRIPDDKLFEAMYKAFIDTKGITTRLKFGKICQYNESIYSRRWGKWESVLFEFQKWVNLEHPDFPYLMDLPSSDIIVTIPVKYNSSFENSGNTSWPKTGNRLYGSIINFRGLQHAPINEQGVVFLFGMVALELGFIVESVITGFPDCEAKRCVSRNKDLWERVKIEFEYQSRNFRDHGHDSSKCDLIICWEDNWPDCPLEILELKTAIESLEN